MNIEEHDEPINIEENPEQIKADPEIIDKKYEYMEKDPNIELRTYECAIVTITSVLRPIILVASIPLVIIGGIFLSITFLCIAFYDSSTYFCQKISNFADNFV